MSHDTGSTVLLLLIIVTEIFVIWLVLLDPKTKLAAFKSIKQNARVILNKALGSVTTIIAVLSLLILGAWILLVVNFDAVTK